MEKLLKICGTLYQIRCFNDMMCNDAIYSYADLLLHIFERGMDHTSNYLGYGDFSLNASNDTWQLKASFNSKLNILEIEEIILLQDAL